MVCEIRIFCLMVLASLLPAVAVAELRPQRKRRSRPKLSR